MLPSSAGMFAAASAARPARSSTARPAKMRAGARPKLGARLFGMCLAVEIARSELDLWRRLRGVACGEFGHRLVAAEGGRGPDHARKSAQLGVVGADRLDGVATRPRDEGLGGLELGLQREEVLVRFEVGIVLAHREQAAERTAELVL